MNNALKIAAVLLCAALSGAWTHGKFISGNMLISGFQSSDYVFVNVVKSCASLQANSGFAYPSVLDADNFPVTNNLTATVFCSIRALPPSYAGAWKLRWSGTQGSAAHPGIQLQSGTTVSNVAGTGCAVSGSTTFNLSVYGTDCTFTFTFTTPPAFASLAFLTGASFQSGMTLQLYEVANETALNANPNAINPDFLGIERVLNPVIIRTLGSNDVNDNNNFTTAAFQSPSSALTYQSTRWEPTVWAGTILGGDAYAATLAGALAVDGQTIQGQITNANTTTSPTLSLNGGTAFPIVQMTGNAVSVGLFPAACLGTFIFDGVLQVWLGSCTANGFGITAFMPLSVQVSIANQLNFSLWYNWPCHITDASVISMGGGGAIGLNAGLTFYSEFCNEVWNFAGGFPQTTWAANRGAALGFPVSNNEQFYGFYGLRVRQIQGSLTALWNGPATLSRVLAFQAFGNTSATNTYRMQGADLNTSLYAQYASLVGVSYNAAPNRPIDYADVLSYATYYQGAVLGDGTNYSGTYAAGDLADCSVAGTNSGGLLCAANNYLLGTPTALAAAYAWIDNDVRVGTKNSVLGSATLLSYASNSVGSKIYAGWNTVAASYSGKKIIHYEGAYSGLAPTVAQCTAISFPGTAATYCGPSGTIALMLTSYKETTTFQQLVTDQFNQFLASSPPAGSMPAWFLMTCAGCQWGLFTGDLYSTPFNSFRAISTFNGHGWLLKRDLDPVSNDNSPLFLDQAV